MEKTSFKLTNSEFEALYDLYEKFVVPRTPQSTSEILVQTLQLQIWLKLRKLDVEYKKKYILKLNAAEELAFMIYWTNYRVAINSYAANLVLQMINLIHPKYV